MLAPWKKRYDQPRQHIKKQRHYFANKVCLVKAVVFPVVMYGYESCTIKKAENQRIDAFELRCWRRLFRVPWTARRCNQSILKEVSPEYSLKGLMLKPKLWSFGHLMQRTDSLEKTLMLGKIKGRGDGDDGGWGGWTASPTQWTWIWVSSGSWWWTGRPGLLQSMGSQRVGHDWVTEVNWTDHSEHHLLDCMAKQTCQTSVLCPRGTWSTCRVSESWVQETASVMNSQVTLPLRLENVVRVC